MEERIYKISKNTYDEERALYNLCDTAVCDCVFAGPADGESALKEARNITVKNSSFSLRYPFWHNDGFEIFGCKLDERTRAPLWYSENGVLCDCGINGVKCLRECGNIKLYDCRIDSSEFGWKCRNVDIDNCKIQSEYFLFESSDVTINKLSFKGKYSFQYIRNMTIDNSELDTKDAFWHTENITVKNSTVKGEYLGWYSRNLTLENCRIIGTQPFCYCENLTLINCTMEETDLAFEYSSVNADVNGHIVSVKNPKSGIIIADSIGEIINEKSVVRTECRISIKTNV